MPLAEVPHITIETNLTCNLKCKTCYNLFQEQVKSLEQIKGEIDLAMTRRRLETITLIGGEPTLHPDLEQVIAYVKSKGLVCQLLTNGVRFNTDKSLIHRVKKAGLDRILLHVDEGQGFSPEKVDEIIDAHFRNFEKHRIYFALSLTIYQEGASSIPHIMRKYARFSFFDGMLATLERETRSVFFDSFGGFDKDYLQMEHDHIASQLEVFPTSYLPGSNSDSEISWLIYFYYINSETGVCFPASRTINRLFRKIYRMVRGREFFATTIPPRLYLTNIIVSLAMEFLFNPSGFRSLLRLTRSSRSLSALRYQYIVIQDGPYFDHSRNALRICYHCPDATIRNGKITPVCVADLINPPDQGLPEGSEVRKVYESVYGHLEQLP